MGNPLISAIFGLAVAGSAYFTIMLILTKWSSSKSTAIEKYNAALEEAKRQEQQTTLRYTVDRRLADAGWNGSLAPIALATGFMYTVMVLVFTLINLPEFVAVTIGLPASLGLMSTIIVRAAIKRRRKFQGQLMQALEQLASQIETGKGPQRALEQLVPGLEDPLGAELSAALSASIATADLVEAMKVMEEKYPSRAMTLFLAALEVDQIQGGTLAPTLRQASALLARQFELAEETAAEISQAKMEFYTILAIVGFIALSLLAGSDETSRQAYLSPMGLALLFGGSLWMLFGIWRGSRVFSKVRGEQL